MSGKIDRWTGFAALSCAVAVALGAFGAHGLAGRVTAKDLDIWKTAAHYHLIHSVALVFLSTLDHPSLIKIQTLMWVGILIFGGTLYGLVLTQVRVLGAITPLGGASLIGAWIWLSVLCFIKKTESP